MKFRQNSVVARKIEGKISSHGAPWMLAAPWEISTPQLVIGSWKIIVIFSPRTRFSARGGSPSSFRPR